MRLGKYEIIKRIASGGMAEIFLARASGLPGFQKMVVIKRILPVLATKGDFLEMFLNEARIAATLQHGNVVQMYDVGVVDGSYFIAMEYLHGEDVRSIQMTLHRQQERLPLEHALHIAIGVCAGLHYAHEKIGYDGQPLKIVHRDVSPQNVIVTYDGAVKLLDFGVAKAAISLNETACGVVKGKIPYMSPEHTTGRPLDRRADVFAVGIMLFELTLGRRLYGGRGTEFEILKRIVEEPVPTPCDLDEDYDPRLEHIVMRALAKKPEERYQTARELQIDLEDLARERRMYMSAIVLQQFMERVFGHKNEAWREGGAGALAPAEGDASVIVEREASDDGATPALSSVLPPALPSVLPPSLPSAVPPSLPSAIPSPVPVAVPSAVPAPEETATPLPPVARHRSRAPAWVAASFALVALVLALSLAAHRTRLSDASREQPRVVGAAPANAAPANAAPGSAEPVNAARVNAAPINAAPANAVSATAAPAIAAPATVAAAGARRESEARARHHKKNGPRDTAQRPRRAEAAPPESARSSSQPPSPSPSSPSSLGSLVLAATPWCEVAIDGVERGPTPLHVQLPAGAHHVRVTNAEFKIDQTIAVVIVPSQTLRRRLQFPVP